MVYVLPCVNTSVKPVDPTLATKKKSALISTYPALQPGSSRVQFSMVSLEVFIDINLPAAL
jgi:hypothetical protein